MGLEHLSLLICKVGIRVCTSQPARRLSEAVCVSCSIWRRRNHGPCRTCRNSVADVVTWQLSGIQTQSLIPETTYTFHEGHCLCEAHMVSRTPCIKGTEAPSSELHPLFNRRLAGFVLWHVLGLCEDVGVGRHHVVVKPAEQKLQRVRSERPGGPASTPRRLSTCCGG